MIVGWYTITRGTEYKLPDGSTKRIGKIFMGWHFFFDKVVGQKRIMYKEGALWAKIDEIWNNAAWRPQWNTLEKLSANRFQVPEYTRDFWSQNLEKFEKTFQCKVLIEGDYVYLYQEMPIYRFPEWVRAPMESCINCMASVYGSAFYWFFVFLAGSEWSIGRIGEFVLWPVFCIIVSALNPIIFKKTL